MRIQNKQTRELVRQALHQDWTAKKTTKGFMLLSPDGKTQVLIHKTNSDLRAHKNIRARLRRAGVNI